ncbi:bifunctional DNA primase/polymerase [Gordonia alkanivorans]|uniref:bifunctional DNA primase/polymerase n=1 Tax=Gordonia alkanivorans TaxID=84096 RepID=UPI00244C6EAE|nr:bifunctional DNA primase/polymerase [Gordonia alkanivorans]MDH3008268.1 bifunctional DNA primase/polymerase [Gordonia alkanivorans]MDH3017210.1 bifunctional DNA primase/polymerase [Gordonia alkanivorans]
MSIPNLSFDTADDESRPPTVPDVSGLRCNGDAALAYVAAGFYVLPVKPGTKNPGSVVGKRWHEKSSRDPVVVRRWWGKNPDYGIALHVGRSGLVVFDLDRPLTDLPDELVAALRQGVSQRSRRADSSNPDRGHYLFINDGNFGNSAGAFAPFGEVRGKNGVIIVAPTEHVDEDGEYRWVKTGPVPRLPKRLRECLREASATQSPPLARRELTDFLDRYVDSERPELLEVPLHKFSAMVAEGMSRHDALVQVMPMAYRDAMAGLYPAREATERLRTVFEDAFCRDDGDEDELKGRRRRPDGREFQETAAWAAAQVASTDPNRIRERRARLIGSEEDEALVRQAFAPGGVWHPDNPNGNVYRLRRGSRPGSQPQDGSIFTLLSADQWASPVPKPRFLIRGVLVEDTFGVVAGPKKSLKTHENQAIALAVSTGKALYRHERFAVDGMHPVLYIVGEGGQADVRRKLQRMCRAYGIDPAEVMRDPTFPLRAAFGAAPMNDPRFNDELKRMLDVAQPELVLIESFYNFHPADVEASNLYQRGQAIDRFHKFVRAECEGATSLMTDHYRSTASKGNDLDLISMAGQAENADSWITRHHREPADVEKGDFRLRVSYNSRQWGGHEYDIDWHLGQFDPYTGTHDGEIRWSVYEDAGRGAIQGGRAGPDPKTLDGRKALILGWIASNPSMTKTASIEALAATHNSHEKRFREAWSVLESERAIKQTDEVLEVPYGDGVRPRKTKVWKVIESGRIRPSEVAI